MFNNYCVPCSKALFKRWISNVEWKFNLFIELIDLKKKKPLKQEINEFWKENQKQFTLESKISETLLKDWWTF